MSDFRKAKILLTAAYKNGEVLKDNFAVPARVTVETIPETPKFRELNLRLAVEAGVSEELLEGLCAGTVFLSIEQMLAPTEREANS